MLAKRLFQNAKRRAILALAGLCLTIGLPGAAQATTYLLTFTGIVSTAGGYIDGYGIFGAPGGSLAGRSYTEVFTITIPTPGAQLYDGLDGMVGGITGIYDASPVIGSLTIGTTTYAFPQVISATYARLIEGTPFGDFYDVLRAEVRGQGNNVFIGTLFADTGGPGSFYHSGEFVAPLDFDINAPYQSAGGLFSYYGADGFGPDDPTYLSLEASHVTFAAQADVPEPSSWAMFIGGFGLIGGMLRRGRRMAASAAAG